MTQWLPGIATVTWPSNAFDAPVQVKVSATTTVDTDDDFRHTAVLYQAADLRGYEIRIDTGGTPPKAPVQVTAVIPDALAAAVSTDLDVQAFVQFLEEGGDDSIDAFEVVPSTKDTTAGTLTLEIPVEAFTASRSADDSHEAILVLGLTPGAHHDPAADGHAPSLAASDVCSARFVGPPFMNAQPRQVVITSPFSLSGHKGVDYQAAAGTPIAAVDAGVVIANSYHVGKAKKNRFGQPAGWGHYVVLWVSDGNMILYAHLKDGTAPPAGAYVSPGDKIGEVDDSGGVTAAHLHLEFVRSGTTYGDARKIDPDRCIHSALIVADETTDQHLESISVYIDGTWVDATQTGQSYFNVTDSLSAGSHTLTLKCAMGNHTSLDRCAPSIWLGRGWKFTEDAGPMSYLDDDTLATGAIPYGMWYPVDLHFVVPPTP
jgi:murein DD-endopeptidase MepM/ murein hydrolase activator NlpD